MAKSGGFLAVVQCGQWHEGNGRAGMIGMTPGPEIEGTLQRLFLLCGNPQGRDVHKERDSDTQESEAL